MSVAVQYETARPGRKRKPARRQKEPTTRAGRKAYREAIAKDHGTPELAERRAELSGDPRVEIAPLAIMLARGDISERQRDAGVKYASLRPVHFGAALPSAAPLEPQRGRSLSAYDPERDARSWAFLKAARARLTRPERTEVDRVAVYDDLPGWWRRLKAGRGRPGDVDKRAALLSGLDALAAHFGLDRRR